jgi:hypothetical protein
MKTRRLELNENAASVDATCRGGLHGHQSLTILPVTHFTFANYAFILPAAPANQIFLSGSTQA